MDNLKFYNLFPLYYRNFYDLSQEFSRIKDMGFNIVYLNPIYYPGFSKSIYAPKEYFNFNTLLVDTNSELSPAEQVKQMINVAHAHELKIVSALVINHSSKDSPLIMNHSSWYLYGKNNEIVCPGIWRDGNWISWNDLAQFDHCDSSDKLGLWNYFNDIIRFYIDLGFDGFCASSAYQIPQDLWIYLIHNARTIKSDLLFMGGNLGGRMEDDYQLIGAGFDILFNSAGWWDFEESWFVEQYNQLSEKTKTIAFPESHDNERIMVKVNNNINTVKRTIVFTGLISSSWMLMSGTEFGWCHRADSSMTSPEDKEGIIYDFVPLVKLINKLRDEYPLLQKEGLLEIVSHPLSGCILIIHKKIENEQMSFYFMINKTDEIIDFTESGLIEFVNMECRQIFSSHDDSDQQKKMFQQGECKIFCQWEESK